MDCSIEITPVVPKNDFLVKPGHHKLTRNKNENYTEESRTTSDNLLKDQVPLTSVIKKPIIKRNGEFKISEKNTALKQKNTRFLQRNQSSRVECKIKPSMIPRPKWNVKETPTKESCSYASKILTNQHKPLLEPHNVQQVHHLNINHEFNPDTQTTPMYIELTRPIPTLGQIYRQDINTFNDWFFESPSTNQYLEVSENPRDESLSNVNDANKSYIEDVTPVADDNTTPNSSRNMQIPLTKVFKTTDENIHDWLTSELDHPTRDNDEQKCNSMVDVPFDDPNVNVDVLQPPTSIAKRASSTFIEEKPTVIITKTDTATSKNNDFTIPKMNTDIKPLKITKTDIFKPIKFPSTPNPQRKKRTPSIPVPSYVEYPSEVLQRTTNFEAEGFNTFSLSVAGLDTDMRDDISSRGALERYSTSTDHDNDWSQAQSSRGSIYVKSSKTSDEESWLSRFEGKMNKHSEKHSSHDYYYHYCLKKEVAKQNYEDHRLRDYKGRCKTCQKYKRRSSIHKISKPLHHLQKRISIGRICRHRWKRVWKKTTERLTNWSKSPSKFGKSRIMDFLQRSTILDHANVQTTTFIYQETGTDAAVAKEKMSAEITTSLTLSSWLSFCKKNDAAITDSSSRHPQSKHVNVGPSLYPFVKTTGGDTTREDRDLPRHIESIVIQEKAPENFQTGFINSQNPSIQNEEKFTLTDTNLLSLDEKVTSPMVLTSILLETVEPKDVHTQTLVTMITNCYDTGSHSKFSSAMTDACTSFGDESKYEIGYINAETSTYMYKESQRSIAIMTSGSYREPVFKLHTTETQITPPPSVRKLVTSTLALEHSFQDTKSTIVTDSTVPCRRLEKILVTPKGTVLSCTGTKITSVSSAYIQTGSIVSSISKAHTVDTAMCTNHASVKNTDCVTSSSIYRCRLKDACLAVSAEALPDRTFFNGGSYHGHRSFSADWKTINSLTSANQYLLPMNTFTINIRPQYSSACVSTDAFFKSNTSTFERHTQVRSNNVSKLDCYAQYSSHRRSSDTTDISRQSAHIGRSRLMSMRMLGDSVSEMATQAQPTSRSAETKTASKQIISTSVMTSRDAFKEKSSALLQSKQTSNTGTIWTCAKATSFNGPKIVEGKALSHGKVSFRNVDNEFKRYANHIRSSNTSHHRSQSQTMAQKETISNLSIHSTQHPNFVISSNLNATKWMKGCAKETDIDIQSIVNLSEITVSESLEKASLAITRLKTPPNELDIFGRFTPPKTPAINCVTEKLLRTVSTVSVACIIPAGKKVTENKVATAQQQMQSSKDKNNISSKDEINLSCNTTYKENNKISSNKDLKTISTDGKIGTFIKDLTAASNKINCNSPSRNLEITHKESKNISSNTLFNDGNNITSNRNVNIALQQSKSIKSSRNRNTPSQECINIISSKNINTPSQEDKNVTPSRHLNTQSQEDKNVTPSRHLNTQSQEDKNVTPSSHLNTPSQDDKNITSSRHFNTPSQDDKNITSSRHFNASFQKDKNITSTKPLNIPSNKDKNISSCRNLSTPLQEGNNMTSYRNLNTPFKEGTNITINDSPNNDDKNSATDGHSKTSNKVNKNITSNVNLNMSFKESKNVTSAYVIGEMVEKVTTDTIKSKKDSLELSPNVRDTATECIPSLVTNRKSASALTSRHVLPFTLPCCQENTNGTFKTDCLFVYERPRCVVHHCHADAAAQIQPSRRDFASKLEGSSVNWAKENITSRSVGLTTSHQSENISEVLPPKVYKALYETTKSIMKKQSTMKPSKNITIQTSTNKTTAGCDTTNELKTQSVLSLPENQPCPHCSDQVHEMLKESSSDVNSHLATSCGYYSNLLTKKLAWVAKNFKRHITPSVEDIVSKATPRFYVEACTMKPSARRDENCQTKLHPHLQKISKQQLCALSPALSVTDIRGSQEKHDLKTVYYILTAIEGRVRRLKNNWQS